MSEGLVLILLAAFLIFGMIAVVSYGEWTVSERKAISWMMTLLPTFLYFVMEFLVWRTKQSWTNAAVSSSPDELELSTDEENPPAKIVASPVHNASNDYDDNDDDDDTANIELPKINPPDTPKQRKPSMIKSPSSRPPIPVSTLAQNFEKKAVI